MLQVCQLDLLIEVLSLVNYHLDRLVYFDVEIHLFCLQGVFAVNGATEVLEVLGLHFSDGIDLLKTHLQSFHSYFLFFFRFFLLLYHFLDLCQDWSAF